MWVCGLGFWAREDTEEVMSTALRGKRRTYAMSTDVVIVRGDAASDMRRCECADPGFGRKLILRRGEHGTV